MTTEPYTLSRALSKMILCGKTAQPREFRSGNLGIEIFSRLVPCCGSGRMARDNPLVRINGVDIMTAVTRMQADAFR